MRKADLVNKISDKTGIQKIDVLVTLESFFKEVKGSLKEGENVYIRGFGSFIVKKRAEKIGRNIKKNTAIVIPAHHIPAFKPAKIFVEAVKKGNKQFYIPSKYITLQKKLNSYLYSSFISKYLK